MPPLAAPRDDPFAQLAAIVMVVFIAKGALAEPFYVPSGSMEPTLLIGDALLASKFPYGYGAASLPIQITLPETTGRLFGEAPKRGDVVVFRWPGDRSQAWVKRVVGLPGDRIQMRQGQLFINDHAANLKADGVGIFLISHDMPDVFGLSDRLSVMKNGKTVGTYRTADVTEDEVLGMIIAGKKVTRVPECFAHGARD